MDNLLELTINDLSRNGPGVARDNEGRVVFVPFTAPGDRVRVKVLEVKKRYVEAQLVELLEPSPQRIAPKCSVFAMCGGCEWQHIPYELQWSTKSRGLKHALERVNVDIAGCEWLDFPAKQIWNYRNRIQLRGLGAQIGFHRRGERKLAEIETCAITRKEIQERFHMVREKGKSLEAPYKVELEVFPDGTVTEAWNRGHATQGFRQVHDEQNETLQQWVGKILQGNCLLLDLYGGMGNLSLPLQNQFTKIFCVDATKHQPERNPAANFEFVRSLTHAWLRKNLRPLHEQYAGNISLIFDPPRMGFGDDFSTIMQCMREAPVKEIVLIGCDPDSWARNVRGMGDLGYKLTAVGALDFFPQTHHVEALAYFQSQ
jgi:23S rRNA (uracil1939-C5)-methyltransferase